MGFIAKIPSLLDEMEKYVKTDVSPETIQKLLKEAPSAEQYKITSIVLSDQNVLKNGRSENGQYILIPEHGEDQWKRVQMFIKNTIDEITPAPTRSPSLSPTP